MRYTIRAKTKTNLSPLLLCLFGLYGCAYKQSPQISRSDLIEFDVAYYLDLNSFTRVEQSPDFAFDIQLNPILNQFWGSPDKGIGMSFPMDSKKSIKFHAERFEPVIAAVLQNHATPRVRTPGLKITPTTTKFARFGTFTDGRDSTKSATYAFIDQVSKNFLLLTFFDRPCTLTGNNHVGGEQFEFDIVIPAGGYYWLAMEEISPSRYVVKLHTGTTTPTFAIQLPSKSV